MKKKYRRFPVDCISPEWVVRFHENYEPGMKDYHDVSAFCEKFRVNLKRISNSGRNITATTAYRRYAVAE